MRVPPWRRAVSVVSVLAAGLGGAFVTANAANAASATVVAHGSLARAAAPDHRLSNSTSSNWSGYAVTGGRYTRVSASWTQPAVDCSVTPTGWSAFWVGLDGDGTPSVEQTGTEADCSSGNAVYSSWYEMYPKAETRYHNAVRPGDSFTASVTATGSGAFTLVLTDHTRGWSRSTTARLKSAALGSAEIIAEAPSSRSSVLPLADFVTVHFSGAKVNGAVLTGSTPGLDRINMADSQFRKATTGSLSSGSFPISWVHS